VLASIPLQQEVAGGETIKNLTYGVVLFSIVFTSFLVLLLEKTRLPDLYAWVLSPGLPIFGRRAIPGAKEMADKTDGMTPDGAKLFGGTTESKKRLPKEDENP
jgi:hypothetical protein